MLALAGYPLGLQFRFLDPDPDPPAGDLAPVVRAEYDDIDALEALSRGCDAATYEFESVPVEAAEFLAGRIPVYPPPAALRVSQERLAEKEFFRAHDIPTPPFARVDDRNELRAAVDELGLPAVLKTRRLGYDGKGQHVLREPHDAEAAWAVVGGAPSLLERFVAFERELSLLAVRDRAGRTALYPLVENHHRGGILRLSIAPAPRLSQALQTLAEDYANRLLSALDYVGVLAIEFFESGGELMANEMAPRVHNSGHWTIEGANVSQFENHVRAVAGLPLGSTAVTGCAAMINLVGVTPPAENVLRVPGASLHLYGKGPRPGRKLGHVTVRAGDLPALTQRVAALLPALEQPDCSLPDFEDVLHMAVGA